MFWWNILIWLGLWNFLPVLAQDFKPKVSFHSDVDTHGRLSILGFDDSRVVLKLLRGVELYRSEDNGVTWDSVGLPLSSDNKPQEWNHLVLDRIYKADVAYLSGENGVLATGDKGKSWKQLTFLDADNHKIDFSDYSNVGDENRKPIINVEIESHPTNKNARIINIYELGKLDGKFTLRQISFYSKDGNNFKLASSGSKSNDDSNPLNMFCSFVQKSSKSKLYKLKDKVICQESTVLSPFGDVSSKLYITDVNFKSLSPFAEQLQDLSPASTFISDNHLFILTLSDRFNENSAANLWRLEDDSTDKFEQISLGTQIRKSLMDVNEIDRRAIITIYHRERNKDGDNNDDEDKSPFEDIFSGSIEALISDSYGKNFRHLSFDEQKASSLTLSTSIFVKKTMFATWTNTMRDFGFFDFRSKVSFDLGNTWSKLKVSDPEGKWNYNCDINSDSNDCGFQMFIVYGGGVEGDSDIFSPGIIAAIGDVYEENPSGDFLKMGTFISRDDGSTWEKVLDFPSRVVMGDYGNIILAVPFDPESDKDPQSEFYFSLDQGKTFQEYQLDKSFYPTELLPSALDGSGNSFMLVGTIMSEDYQNLESVSYVVDFSDAFKGASCKTSDMEDWYYSNGQCVDGTILKFRRRKQDAQCLIKTTYKDLTFEEELCGCSELDYECADDFSIDSAGKCVPDFSKASLMEKCESKKSIQLEPKKISKTTKCKRPQNIIKEEISCAAVPAPSNVKVTENKFSSIFKSYQYFDTFVRESILFRTDKSEAYVSHDGGQNIKQIQTGGEDILEINFNPFFNSSAYLFGKNKNLFATHDYGLSFKVTELPAGRQLGFPLSFHAKDIQTFIYYGGESCESFFDPNCHAVAYITRDGGASFEKLLEGASNCEFLESAVESPRVENGIVCMVKDKSTGARSYVSSTDYFKTQTVLYSDILGFMSTGGYIVVAVSHGERQLRAYLTIDGVEYSEAVLPADLDSYEQKAFTVLGSQEGAIFMHMTTNLDKNEEFGALLKSNTEGTSFVILERAVNRNSFGFVDFEKIQGLEGIILINTVANAKEIVESKDKTSQKKLKTKITFNDGADWTYIKPPSVDSEGKKYNCNPKNLEKCSLNLHGFTERKDVRDTYSSGSAIGYMFALGNVGEYLTPVSEASTFMTNDGGISWSEVKKGSYQWEYGDHGSVLVLVKDNEPTDTVSYSINGGKTWKDYQFASEKINVYDLVTVPRDSAMRFLVIGSSVNVRGEETRTYTLDFVDMFSRQCQYSKDDLKDFEYISLSHPNTKECLFGHKAKYLRKKSDDCYVGMAPLEDKFRIFANCSCTRNDYECDYNFMRVSDGTCKLIDGLKPADPKDICSKDNSLIEYFEPTGYRKIALSTCNGGLMLANSDSPHPCPGKEKEFKEKYKVNHTSFLAIWIFAVLIFTGMLSFIYYRGIKRNGGFARFGEIRLGDDDLIEENNTDRAVNTVLRNGVFLFSNVYTGLQYFGHQVGNFFKRGLSRFGNTTGPSYQSLLHDQFLDDADDLLVGHDEDADDLASFIENEGNFEIGNDEEVDLSSDTPTHAPYSDNPEEANPHEST